MIGLEIAGVATQCGEIAREAVKQRQPFAAAAAAVFQPLAESGRRQCKISSLQAEKPGNPC